MNKLLIIFTTAFFAISAPAYAASIEIKAGTNSTSVDESIANEQIEEEKPVTLEILKKSIDELKNARKGSRDYADSLYYTVDIIKRAAMLGGAVYLYQLKEGYNYIPFFLAWGAILPMDVINNITK
ncbi:hypothetical protein JKY79_03120 [Candidatus Babeliales bacterium]|nr:hypothetical protein [Candidatus Babeliales bacterium]